MFREGFRPSPRALTPDQFLIKFKTSDGQAAAAAVPEAAAPGRVEIGPDAVKDPKWAQVNDNAKRAWAARLGQDPVPGGGG